jgi:hypothetical protein
VQVAVVDKITGATSGECQRICRLVEISSYGYSLRAKALNKPHHPANCLVDLDAKEIFFFFNDSPALCGPVDIIRSEANSWFT